MSQLRDRFSDANERFARGIACFGWTNSGRGYGYGRGGSTGVMTEWEKFKKTQHAHGIADPNLVCIDIGPYGNTQAPDRQDILNIGGFSDAVLMSSAAS